MKRKPDYLDILALDTMNSLQSGFYGKKSVSAGSLGISLKEAIKRNVDASIISEIKFCSPSAGMLKTHLDPGRIAKQMEEGGAVAVSVLTEPKHFCGQIKFLAEVRDQVNIPILMKDLVMDEIQIDTAFQWGADVVLLIKALFDRGYCRKNVQTMIDYSHSRGLEVLLETHTEAEFQDAVETEADMIGINNRNLATLNVDLNTTKHILASSTMKDKTIISESGVRRSEDIVFLRECGAHAFLVGTTIMKSENIGKNVKRLVKS